MRGGLIVETGTTSGVFTTPQHEYTRSLLASTLDRTELRRPVGTAVPVAAHRSERSL